MQGVFVAPLGLDPSPGVFARLSHIPARHAEGSIFKSLGSILYCLDSRV